MPWKLLLWVVLAVSSAWALLWATLDIAELVSSPKNYAYSAVIAVLSAVGLAVLAERELRKVKAAADQTSKEMQAGSDPHRLQNLFDQLNLMVNHNRFHEQGQIAKYHGLNTDIKNELTRQYSEGASRQYAIIVEGFERDSRNTFGDGDTWEDVYLQCAWKARETLQSIMDDHES